MQLPQDIVFVRRKKQEKKPETGQVRGAGRGGGGGGGGGRRGRDAARRLHHEKEAEQPPPAAAEREPHHRRRDRGTDGGEVGLNSTSTCDHDPSGLRMLFVGFDMRNPQCCSHAMPIANYNYDILAPASAHWPSRKWKKVAGRGNEMYPSTG